MDSHISQVRDGELADSREVELAQLLADLTAVQDEMLDVLSRKRTAMAACDLDGMIELEPREAELCQRLQQCSRRRAGMLESARAEGLPDASIAKLASAMPRPARDKLGKQVNEASSRVRLLQHESLTNWVLAQRTLLHLAQMLEIIATGGQWKPTYEKGGSAPARGALVDKQV